MAAPRRDSFLATSARREEICEVIDDTSSNSSLEEWEATEDGGFARAEVGESVWYVYGFEPDGRGGWCELWRRHPAQDPFETFTRPRALRPSRPGPPWVSPPPRGGAHRGPGGIPAGHGFSLSPGARPMGVPGILRSATEIRPTSTTTRVPELVQVATIHPPLRGFPRSGGARWMPTYTCYLSIGRDTHGSMEPYWAGRLSMT